VRLIDRDEIGAQAVPLVLLLEALEVSERPVETQQHLG
jgi:hypothetical protein